MPKRDEETIEITGADLTEAMSAIEQLMKGGTVTPNPKNPMLSGILASLEDTGLKGYRKGRQLSEAETRALPVGAVVWVLYCKDNNPKDVRTNGACRITAIDSQHRGGIGYFEAHDGYHWSYDGETGRGWSHYFEAVVEPATPRAGRKIGTKKKRHE